MSAGCDFDLLDCLVAGELGAAEAEAARAHAAGCTRCAHELAWLSSERALFEQRARREQAESPGVASAFTSGGEAESPVGPPAISRALSPAQPRRHRWGLVAAAACLFVVALSPQVGRPRHPRESIPSSLSEPRSALGGASVDPQWAIASLEQQVGACLLATPRAGLTCGAAPEIPASFGLAGD